MAWDISMDSVYKHQVCETRLLEEEQKWQESRQKLRDSCGGQSQQHSQCLPIYWVAAQLYTVRRRVYCLPSGIDVH